MQMIDLTIKKGKKGILRFPTFLSSKASYILEVNVTKEMLTIGNDDGWHKVTGVNFFYHHWNSARLVNRSDNKYVYFGYYLYCKGVSPQENKLQKSHLSDPNSILTCLPGDTVKIMISPFRHKTEVYMQQLRHHDYGREIINELLVTDLPPMKYMHWPVWMAEPHLKDKAKTDINYSITII